MGAAQCVHGATVSADSPCRDSPADPPPEHLPKHPDSTQPPGWGSAAPSSQHSNLDTPTLELVLPSKYSIFF